MALRLRAGGEPLFEQVELLLEKDAELTRITQNAHEKLFARSPAP